MDRPHIGTFEYWIEAARWDLGQLPNYSTASVRRMCLVGAAAAMRQALMAANRSGCAARKALCLRVLNWIKADLRRLG